MEEKTLLAPFKIKLFGLFRELAENKEITLQVADQQVTVADLKQQLTAAYPKLASANMPFVIAVNRKVANDSSTVAATDEIAVLPLVSGG